MDRRKLTNDEINYILSGVSTSSHPVEYIRNSINDANKADILEQLTNSTMIVNDETLGKLKQYIESLYSKCMFSNGTGLGARCASAIVGTQSQSNLDVKRLAASGGNSSNADVLSIMRASKSPPDAGLYIVPSIPLRYDYTWRLAMSMESKVFSDYVVDWGINLTDSTWWTELNGDIGSKYRIQISVDKNLIASTGVNISNLTEFFRNNAVQKKLASDITLICSASPYSDGLIYVCVDRYSYGDDEFLIKDVLYRSYQNVMKKKTTLHGYKDITAVSVSSVPLMSYLTFHHIEDDHYRIDINSDGNMFKGVCYREVLALVNKFNENSTCLCYNVLTGNSPGIVNCSEILLNSDVYRFVQPIVQDGKVSYYSNQQAKSLYVYGVNYNAITEQYQEQLKNPSMSVSEYDIFNPNRITTRGGSLGEVSSNVLVDEQMSYSIGVYPMYTTLGLICARNYSLRELITNTGCDAYHSYAAASWTTKGPTISSNEIGKTVNDVPITSSAISSAPLHIMSACISSKTESSRNPQVALLLGQTIEMGDTYPENRHQGCDLNLYGSPKTIKDLDPSNQQTGFDEVQTMLLSRISQSQSTNMKVLNLEEIDDSDMNIVTEQVSLLSPFEQPGAIL